MLMSVFVQNIVHMIVNYALWAAVLKRELSMMIEGRSAVSQMNKDGSSDK